MPDARYNVSVNFTVTRDGSGFKQMQSELGRIATATEKTAKQGGLRWTELKSQIDLVSGGLRTMARVGEQAFRFAQEGGRITQLRDSFERANEEIFKTPDLLERMRSSARGTVRDVTLMSGVLTLAAGQSDEVARSMAEASPRLLEIAKAANKPNPALGDTTFFFDSLSKGIKRQSPLILDNLGLTIKAEPAYAAYAASVGKAVSELDAQERVQAFLNETLRAGDQLMAQVGGNVDSAADSYARLEVKVENATNKLKEFASEGLIPVIEGIEQSADAITNEYGAAVDAIVGSNLEASKSMSQLVDDAAGVQEALHTGLGLGPILTGTETELKAARVEYAKQFAAMATDAEQFNQALEAAFEGQAVFVLQDLAVSLGLPKSAADDSADALFRLAKAVLATGNAGEDADRKFALFVSDLERAANEASGADRKFFDFAGAVAELGEDIEGSTAALTGQARTLIQAQRVLEAQEKAARDTAAGIEFLAEAELRAAAAADEYTKKQVDLQVRLEELRPAIDAAKNDILGINESLGLAGGRAAFEIFVDATQAQAEIDAFNSSLDGIEDSYKTTIELDADQATEEAAALAEELIKNADRFEAIVTSNAAEEIEPAERLHQQYDDIAQRFETELDSNALFVLDTQVTPLQAAYDGLPEEQITEFLTPGLDEAISETERLQGKLGELPSQKDININVHVNQTGSADAPGVEIPGFATGGRFIVPPGYDEKRNPFIVAVESGEEVIVRPQSERQRADNLSRSDDGGGVSQDTYHIYNNTREAAALQMAMIDERRRKRLNRYMGVG